MRRTCILPVAVIGLALSGPSFAEDISTLTTDISNAGALCADSTNFQNGENVFCKVSDNSAGGVRPVSSVIDPCTGTVFAGDARTVAGARMGGIRVIPNWFDSNFDPAQDEVFIANPLDEPAGLNGLDAMNESTLVTGDRFTGRVYFVNLHTGKWEFQFQTEARQGVTIGSEACFGPGAEEPGPGSACIGPGINNIEIDDKGRIWAPVTTRRGPGGVALSDAIPDGYVVLREKGREPVEFFGGVGEGFRLANGLRVDPAGEYVYLVETLGTPPRIVRMKIIDERGRTTLGEPEDYVLFPSSEWEAGFGPVNPGPDDIAFDEDGNLYVVMVFTSALVVIPPVEADTELPSLRPVHIVFDATTPNPEDHERALADFTGLLNMTFEERGRGITGADFLPLTAGTVFTNNPTGLSFGGLDRKRIFINSRGSDVHTFEGLVPGVNPFKRAQGAVAGKGKPRMCAGGFQFSSAE